MSDTPSPLMQRRRGTAAVAVSLRGGRVRLDRLAQAGAARAFLPRVHRPVPEAVFLNTAGGLTGGDTLAFALELAPGARLTATTQTAERAYAAGGGVAAVTVTGTVCAGGRLDWLPQETILYEDCAIDRRTVIDLANDAACLLCESIVIGRTAMREAPRRARLIDRRMVRRNGRPVWAETTRLDAAALARQGDPAILGGASAFAVIALIAPGAEDAAPYLRAALGAEDVTAAASGFDGKCVARLAAADGWPRRRAVARAGRAARGAAAARLADVRAR